MKNNINLKFLLCAVALYYRNAYAQISLGTVEGFMGTDIYGVNKDSLSWYVRLGVPKMPICSEYECVGGS